MIIRSTGCLDNLKSGAANDRAFDYRPNHDLSRKRSFVHFQWKNDPEKHLSLDVPFECTLDRLPKEARKALEALSDELALATIATPP